MTYYHHIIIVLRRRCRKTRNENERKKKLENQRQRTVIIVATFIKFFFCNEAAIASAFNISIQESRSRGIIGRYVQETQFAILTRHRRLESYLAGQHRNVFCCVKENDAMGIYVCMPNRCVLVMEEEKEYFFVIHNSGDAFVSASVKKLEIKKWFI